MRSPPNAPTLRLATDSGSSGSDGLTNVKTVNVGNIEAGAGWEYQVDGGAWTRGNVKLSDVTLAALGGTIAGGWSPGSLKASAVDLQVSGNTKTVWLVGFDGGNTKGVQLDFAEDANGRLTARVNQAAFASGDHRSDWATTGKTTVDIATGDSASGYGLKGLTINGVPGAGGGYLNLGRTAVGDAFLLSEGEHKYLVRQTDMAGNTATSDEGRYTLDSSVGTPTIGQISADDRIGASEKEAGIEVKGTAEALSSVEVTWGTTTKTVTADASGNWKADFSKAEVPADGSTTVTVQATDAAGNTSTAQTKSVSVDTTAVSAPSIERVSDDVGSVMGTVADKGYTDDTTPTVRVKLQTTPKVVGGVTQSAPVAAQAASAGGAAGTACAGLALVVTPVR